jgi:small subunit ribosomal protein S20
VANIKSQIKRNRQNERRRLRNKAVKSELKTRIKRADEAVAASAEDAGERLRRAVKALDMAAAKGIIHKNQAANRKSKLMKRVARATASTQAP